MRLVLACLCVAVAAGCASSASPARPPIANAKDVVPGRPTTTRICSGLPSEVAPIDVADLERETTPQDPAAARTLLLGPWSGFTFALDGELGQPGSEPHAEGYEAWCFDVDGRASKGPIPHGTDDMPEDSPECRPRSRSYVVRRDAEMGGTLVLEETMSGGCPDSAGYYEPYVHPYYVNRLDERVLVLIDGVTGRVSGYRRR